MLRPLIFLLFGGGLAQAIQFDLGSTDSIKAGAKIAAEGMMHYYHPNEPGQTLGKLVQPYYWWEAGAMFGQLIEYWFYTGDTQYNDITTQGLMSQIGPNHDFMVPQEAWNEGNDDQVFWAFAAMSAAELGFPDPPSQQPSWLSLAQATFKTQVPRWDTMSCGGGLRWQIYPANKGYEYKNTISNGGLFQLAARLARYTNEGKDGEYGQWADKLWDWLASTSLLGPHGEVYDGVGTGNNCKDITRIQWTYNSGTMLMGAANMYNHTGGDSKWKTRIESILQGAELFFPVASGGNTMVEVACEPHQRCNNDQPSFKAYLSRWMAATTQLAPFTTDSIMPKLRTSAQAAAATCSGGTDGVTCGQSWLLSKWDGKYGVGEQMSAMSVMQANLISQVAGPATQHSSKRNARAAKRFRS